MGLLSKLFGGSKQVGEVKVTKLNIGIILGSTRQGRVESTSWRMGKRTC